MLRGIVNDLNAEYPSLKLDIKNARVISSGSVDLTFKVGAEKERIGIMDGKPHFNYYPMSNEEIVSKVGELLNK